MKNTFFSFLALTLWACDTENPIEKIPNMAPSISILSHTDGAVFLEGESVQFYAQASDETDAMNQLTTSWYADDQLVCDWATPEVDGTTRCDITIESDMTRVSVQVNDPAGEGSVDDVSISVTPTEPPNVQIISPAIGEVYYSNQLILFSAILEDAEDD